MSFAHVPCVNFFMPNLRGGGQVPIHFTGFASMIALNLLKATWSSISRTGLGSSKRVATPFQHVIKVLASPAHLHWRD